MTLRVWLAFLALCVIWGIPYLFIKKAIVEVSPLLGLVLILLGCWLANSSRDAAH